MKLISFLAITLKCRCICYFEDSSNRGYVLSKDPLLLFIPDSIYRMVIWDVGAGTHHQITTYHHENRELL